MSKRSRSRKIFTSLLVVILLVVGFSFFAPGSDGLGFFGYTISPPASSGDSATSRARDAQRKSDLQQIALALELYVNDNGGGFPNASGCIQSAFNRAGFDFSDYLPITPADPSDLRTSTVVTGGCNIVGGGGYGYIALNTDTSNEYAEGYLLIARLESSSSTDTGVYYNTSAWTPTTTGSNATADYNLGVATRCTSTTTACTSSVNRYYMIGRDL